MNEVVGDDEWLAIRVALMEKAKDLTRLRDEVSAARRAMPWRNVYEDYTFDCPDVP
jgi:predicted dithiol-disulfide oxidoreductase (DUF899 family)